MQRQVVYLGSVLDNMAIKSPAEDSQEEAAVLSSQVPMNRLLSTDNVQGRVTRWQNYGHFGSLAILELTL